MSRLRVVPVVETCGDGQSAGRTYTPPARPPNPATWSRHVRARIGPVRATTLPTWLCWSPAVARPVKPRSTVPRRSSV